jgi:hypothetical protein
MRLVAMMNKSLLEKMSILTLEQMYLLNWLTILPLVKYVMYSENQITNSSIKNKVPNFNSFEIWQKKFNFIFDFHRYIFAKCTKLKMICYPFHA